ncbi:MAG: hypothetical protein KDC87_16450 [Planctomycetes bacterium]|nr:hypothetical protein [Planctomycetota bacterium]MCB9869925.1 hypothetical protein [Planctomycetota bacterium]
MNPLHLCGDAPDVPDLRGERIQTFAHGLAGHPLFSDESLERLLDDYPRSHLHVTTMGRCFAEGGWRTGEVVGLRGSEILRAVRDGHLWLNIKYLHAVPEYAALTNALYEEIASRTGRRPPGWKATTLLVSSPGAFVHYHADSVPNILWHLRGSKRVMVYPVRAPFAEPESLESICAGAKDEALAYDAAFEADAQCVDLHPGQAVMWPQHSPHRVENRAGLNVSLSTEHMTPEVRRRVDVLRSNRVLRRLHLGPRSARSDGFGAYCKVGLALLDRVLQRVRHRAPIHYRIPATFRVDPNSPTGFHDLP